MKKFFVGIFLVAILSLLGGYVWVDSYTPQRASEQVLPGLHGDVNVSFDAYGIPHIFGQSKEDTYQALGYIHAMDRLFQMDLYRRLAQGRLAEFFGKPAVEADRYFRTLGIHETSKKQRLTMQDRPVVLKLTMAYLRGINSFIQQGDWPIEYSILRVKPTPFDVVDSLSILNYMSTTFSGGLRTDLMLTAMKDKLGTSLLEELDFAPGPEKGKLMAALVPLIDETSLATLDRIEAVMDSVGRFHGSNAWLIPASQSQSGHPILANDTHIKYSNPPVWYEAQISSPNEDLYGYFLAGVPFPMLGQTRQYAWGLTIFPHDTVDVIADRRGETGHTLIRRGQSLPLNSRQEIIRVKGDESIKLEVLESDFGPIINHLFPQLDSSTHVYSLFSTLVTPEANPLPYAHDLAYADSAQRFKDVTNQMNGPSLNVFYAHQKEGVFWAGVGRIRGLSPHLSEYFIQDGATFSPNFVAREQYPRSFDETGQIITNANHHPQNSPQSFAGYYPRPFRFDRIKGLLEKQKTWSIEELKSVQTDIKSPFWPLLKPHVQGLISKLPSEQAAIVTNILNWDGRLRASSHEATLFVEFLALCMAIPAYDHLDQDLGTKFLKSYVANRSLAGLFANPNSKWWDLPSTTQVESRDDILVQAMTRALDALELQFGSDVKRWAWGSVHTLTLEHPLGKGPMLGLLLNIGPTQAPGGLETVNSYHHRLTPGEKKVVAGAATRRLIDLKNPAEALSILPGGQGSALFDPHRDDQWGLYLKGEYRAATIVKAPMGELLILRPQS